MPKPPKWQPNPGELEEIRRRSADLVKETPVFSFGELSRRFRRPIAVKAENLQRTGSFKLRGTLAKLRAAEVQTKRGVVAGSAGNHGQALAYAARALDLPCTVFMPRRAALSKVEAVTAFGAQVEQAGESVDDCVRSAREKAEEDDLLFVHPFDDLDVIKGQAGVGVEIHRQIPDLAQIIVPVGGGGLISGIAAALRALATNVKVIGVQAAGCAPFKQSLRKGHPVEIAGASTMADGIAVRKPGDLPFALVSRWVDEFVAVDDDAIADAMVMLVERGKLVVEAAGAVGVAALASGAVAASSAGTTVAILSGGNVDASVLAGVINRHQTEIGRRIRLFTRISDRPGGLAKLLTAIARAEGNVLDVTHVRDGVALGIEETGVEVLIESRGERHRAELLERMREEGYELELQ